MITPKGILGVDVSHYQKPGLVPWNDSRIGFGYVKFSEATFQDSGAQSHVTAITAAGKMLGGYHFFEPDIDQVEQLATFVMAAEKLGYGQGDLIPGLDVERCITRGKWENAEPSWNTALEALAEGLAGKFGDVLIYCGWATFIQLGSPSWLLERRLWVPYVSVDGYPPPTTCHKSPGGKAPDLWQFLWAPMFSTLQESTHAGAVDQDVCDVLPPTIQPEVTAA